MKYIETVPLMVHIYPKQRKTLEKLQSDIKEEYNIKIPLSELVREALNQGLPHLLDNKDFILQRIG
ncbi:MAG: hypothetical protein KO318_06060 [Methanobacterium sp.]|uniref:hypothetical protein n=1 Tax=Methanobacterium sp. TaxID=2164 RepID=UPI00258C5AC0|nr:hypothetical protein [Methanobacterium sp.]MCC7559978.1 hypothetical protein [Methanobacterium sp.]